ncbi:MAG: HD domain-containing protein [Bacilli bacterium]
MKCDVFKTEIAYLSNEDYQKDIKELLNLLPDYFYEVPASSTGKYHPTYALNAGGLVRHTKAAVRIAYELLQNASVGYSFTNEEKDLILMALLLHDGLKSGMVKSEYTKFEHPLLVSKFIKENKNKTKLKDKDIILICSMIESHMGQWNTNQYSKFVLPLPDNKYKRFVHMCDYLASRKFLEVPFKDNEIIF